MHGGPQMARARMHRQFGKSPGRLTTWIGPADQAYITVAAGATVLLAFLSFEEPLTVIRTRGAVSVRPTDPSVNAACVGAFGVGIVSAEALAIGVSAIPGPFSSADWGGWLVWRSFAFHWDVTTDVGRAITSLALEIDSKAMRKVDANSALVVVVESQAVGFDVFDGTRHLLKLS